MTVTASAIKSNDCGCLDIDDTISRPNRNNTTRRATRSIPLVLLRADERRWITSRLSCLRSLRSNTWAPKGLKPFFPSVQKHYRKKMVYPLSIVAHVVPSFNFGSQFQCEVEKSPPPTRRYSRIRRCPDTRRSKSLGTTGLLQSLPQQGGHLALARHRFTRGALLL